MADIDVQVTEVEDGEAVERRWKLGQFHMVVSNWMFSAFLRPRQ